MIPTDNIRIPLSFKFNEETKKMMVPLHKINGLAETEKDGETVTLVTLDSRVYTTIAGHYESHPYIEMPLKEANEFIDDTVNKSLEKTYKQLQNSRLQIN